MSHHPLITDNLKNSSWMNGVEESNTTESGMGHRGTNKDYVNESDDAEHDEVKMNGVDESDVSECGSFHVNVSSNCDGNADVIDSGSDGVVDQTKNVNKYKDGGNVAVKLCKKTYVLTNAVPAQGGGHVEVIEGSNLSSHNCVEAVHINDLVPLSERMMSEEREIPCESVGRSDRTTPEVVDVPGKGVDEITSPAADVRPAHVNPFLVLADSTSACTNGRLLPANCDDPDSTNNDRVNVQLALSSPETELSLSPLSDDVFPGTKNGGSPVDGEIAVVGKYCERTEAGQEWKPVSSRMMSNELPTVHKEGSEAFRHQLINCQMVSARLISDNLQMERNESSEADRQRQCGNCQLPMVHGEGIETDRHQPTNSQSPTLCRLDSDNLPKTESMGVETDRSTRCEFVGSRGIETDRQRQQTNPQTLHKETKRRDETGCRLRKVECRSGETDGCHRRAESQLASVHKRQLLVDCDVESPHSVWTTVVGHNSSACDGGRASRGRSSSRSANDVRYFFADLSLGIGGLFQLHSADDEAIALLC